MSERMKSPGIDRMSLEERVLLIQEIMDSITKEQSETPLTDLQQAELSRRLASHKANPLGTNQIRSTRTFQK